MIGRPSDYFITCYTVLTRPNKVGTAVHGCNSWLSVWTTLSCRCPVKLSTWYQLCIIVTFLVSLFFGWSDLLQIPGKPAASSFAVLCIIVFRSTHSSNRARQVMRFQDGGWKTMMNSTQLTKWKKTWYFASRSGSFSHFFHFSNLIWSYKIKMNFFHKTALCGLW